MNRNNRLLKDLGLAQVQERDQNLGVFGTVREVKVSEVLPILEVLKDCGMKLKPFQDEIQSYARELYLFDKQILMRDQLIPQLAEQFLKIRE